MAITNLTLDCSTYNYQNHLTFDYSGAGVSADVYVNYGAGAVLLDSIVPLNSSGNELYDTDIANVCTETASYYVIIKNSSGTTIETSATVQCTNTCVPDNPNINFDVDCSSVTNKGMKMTLSAFGGNASLAPYISLRIYRSTDNITYTLIATVAYTTTEYVDTTANADTSYYYKVEYYNALNGAVSATPRVDGPCTTAETACGSNFPLYQFEFNTESSTCAKLVITDLFNDNTTFKIPDQYACYNIASITAITMKVWDYCYSTESNANEINLSTTSSYYVPLTKNVEMALTQGVYRVKLKVTYLDSYGQTKTVTQEQCVFICGDLKCDLAKLVAADITNSEIVPLYTSLEYLAECNQCASACEVYQYLNDYERTCC